MANTNPDFQQYRTGFSIGMCVLTDEANTSVIHFENLTESLSVLREFNIEDAVAIKGWLNHRIRQFRRNRIQFVAEFPLFALMLAVKVNQGCPTCMEIETIIDRGEPLIEKMASKFYVKKESVRFLCGKGLALVGNDWRDDPIKLLWAIDTAPSGSRPRNHDEWAIFKFLWKHCGSWRDQGKRFILADYIFHDLCHAGYESSMKKLGQLFQDDLNRMYGVHDYFYFIAEWRDSLRKQHTDADNPAWENINHRFLMRYSAIELFKQSERWHREISQLAILEVAPEMGNAELSNWPPLLPQPLNLKKRVMVSLTTSRQLSEEGFRLGHCVSGYSDGCLLGDSHILSIRNPDGIRLSTVEIFLKAGNDGQWIPVVIQHRADRNGSPSKTCIEALTCALEFIQEPAFQKHLQEIQAFHLERRDKVRDYLNFRDSRLSIEVMCQVMMKVLGDYEHAMAWLKSALSVKRARQKCSQ